MTYNIYQLLWIFFIYSFIGWCGEVVLAAVNRHKFVNRGFVSCPLCPVYGAGAVAVSVFLPELEERLFFLFLGGMIVTAFVEYLTGRLLELIFHKKWWDYSDQKFQLDGYVCLKNSVIWGICSVLVIRIFNPLLCRGLELLPMLLGEVLLWVLGVLLAIDFIGSGIAVLGLKKQGRISQITEELHRTSKILENALTERIQRRMVKAFPNIESGGLSGSLEKGAAEKGVKAEEKARFAQGCGFFKLASLFILGAFLGDIVETIFCFLTTGKLMSRSSLVFGQFSIVWGLACALLTWMLYRYRDRSDRFIFVFGTVLGGAYEYICSVFTEIAFGTVFWDYSEIPFNLGGRINLLYCFFWGIATVVWIKYCYPLLSRWIERLPLRLGRVLTWLIVLFMVVNMALSALALGRFAQRQSDPAPAQDALGQFLDERFPDGRMERIYPNIQFVD